MLVRMQGNGFFNVYLISCHLVELTSRSSRRFMVFLQTSWAFLCRKSCHLKNFCLCMHEGCLSIVSVCSFYIYTLFLVAEQYQLHVMSLKVCPSVFWKKFCRIDINSLSVCQNFPVKTFGPGDFFFGHFKITNSFS